jgi:hypothetical protein
MSCRVLLLQQQQNWLPTHSIVESGTHNSLMAAGGAYSQLVQRQVFGAGGSGGDVTDGVGSAGAGAGASSNGVGAQA